MTETTRPTECSAPTLDLAFELGSTKWTLAFATRAIARPRIRTIAAGDLAALRREIELRAERFGLARGDAGVELLRGGAGWVLVAPVVAGAGHPQCGGRFLEY